LTIYARNPSKLPADIKGDDKVTTVEGQLDDEASLKQAVNSGAKVFVSFAGPVMDSKGTVCVPFLFPSIFDLQLLASCPYPTHFAFTDCSSL
jgi:hypothetical protein